MSKASETFSQSILDAEHLLKHFNELNTKPPPPDIEVLKRAGLVMAMTAWETYVEDRVAEATDERLRSVGDESIARLVRSKLKDEISRLHNPTSEKTTELFRQYADVDLNGKWSWNGSDDEATRKRLNDYIKLRGDVVHRSRRVQPGPPEPHPVKQDELEKAIRFLKALVQGGKCLRANASPRSLRVSLG
jgi:HEPN superfamily RiboL-PSP-like protein